MGMKKLTARFVDSIKEPGPTLGEKQEDLLNIIIAYRDTGISQSEIIEN